MDLSKEELETEVKSIEENINAHKQQMSLHEYGIKVDSYIKELFEKKLEKFK